MHPREFGKYRIVKLLPLGGMGRVYLAIDQSNNRNVALKLIEIGPEPEIREIVEAERRGAILQARLCGLDPRVTIINTYGDLDGFFYIEMEFVEGQDLSEVLAKGPLGTLFAARIAWDICEVLAHAHNFTAEIEGHRYHGIVHGDIKPRNIRITPDGQVKVLDFGIAKALSLTRQFTTNQFGSSQYSSPERLNTGEVDVASDLWSVGVVLYEAVTGKPYFVAENSSRLEHQIRTYRVHRPLPPDLPARFRSILLKVLHPDPERRYSDARSLANDLKAFIENRPTIAENEKEEDFEATRRTAPPSKAFEDTTASDTAPTRRVSDRVPPPPPPPVPSPEAVPLPLLQRQRKKRRLTPNERRIRTYAGIGAFLVVAFLFYNEYASWRGADALQREIQSERLTDMSLAWTRYEALTQRSVLPVVLSGARNAIQDRLTGSADRVIREYRDSDAPSVSEADWVRAQAALARALQLDPGDDTLRGKMYICEGHILRIRAGSKDRGKLYYESRAKFEQARDLISKSPDPYLGLTRLYIYAFKDVEKAEDAIREARKRGHDEGKREKAQLADGYKDRAERLMREATRAAGYREEKEYLDRARDDYERAEELYREIVPFANSTVGLRRVGEQLEQIDVRMEALQVEAVKEGA